MEVIYVTEHDATVVTVATWRPGLPPPIEELQAAFPPEDGYTIEYGTSLRRDEGAAGNWLRIPVAIVIAPDGSQWTFVPPQQPADDLGG